MERTRHPEAWFALTIFCSAFLLFQVQPVIGRIILPWFGGTPAAWTTCLLFFQAALLGGYLYAHLVGSLARRRVQVAVHLVVLLLSLSFLPFTPGAAWKPVAGTAPTPHLLLLLLVHIGAPFFLLSSTNPLVQRWFAACRGGPSPYRLYALSNAGSLLALVSYPVLVEPLLAVRTQVLAWSGLYLVYAAGAAVCGMLFLRGAEACAASATPGTGGAPEADQAPAPRPSPSDLGAWVLLAAAASAMLMATTNQLCQEVASVPFLWILPLGLYLLSFIVCFDHDRWYDRRVWGALLLLSVPLATHVLVRGVAIDMAVQLPVLALVLFACCMTCHGELVRARPSPRHLTLFYLAVATGGVLGGAFVVLAAPRWFDGFREFHIALAASCLLTLLAWYRRAPWRGGRWPAGLLWGGASAYMAVLVMILSLQAATAGSRAVCSRRNFFGVLTVKEGITRDGNGDPHRIRSMYHGRIRHGFQFIDPARANEATAYYGPGTGIYYAMHHHPRRAGAVDGTGRAELRVGVVGLGTGTLAALAREGDELRFYEINPDVIELARDPFSYLDDSAAEVDLVLGDGRLELEREADEGRLRGYDLLVLDAFIGDAVPIHLLTVECVAVYLRHLAPGGLLVLNISNRYVDMVPVVVGIAEHYGLHLDVIDSERDPATAVSYSRWAILAPDAAFADQPEVRPHLAPWAADPPDPLLWTDDFSSLWPLIMW